MQVGERRRMEARSLSWIWRCGNSERYLNAPLIVQLRYIPSLFLHLTANCAGIEDLLVPPRKYDPGLMLARASGPHLILTNHPESPSFDISLYIY